MGNDLWQRTHRMDRIGSSDLLVRSAAYESVGVRLRLEVDHNDSIAGIASTLSISLTADSARELARILIEHAERMPELHKAFSAASQRTSEEVPA